MPHTPHHLQLQCELYAAEHQKVPIDILLTPDAVTIGQVVMKPADLLYIIQTYQDLYGGIPVHFIAEEWRGLHGS